MWQEITIGKRWGMQGVNYISSLITLGRGDLAAAIVAMPTYAKSTIIAETNMRAFGLNDAAIAAQENALKADMKSPVVVASSQQIAKLQAVEARKTELIAGGALGDQSALVQKMNVAGKMLNQSKSVFDQAVRKEQAGRNTLVLAQAAFHQNMVDTKAADALVDAIANLQNASGERRKAEQTMKAGQQALDDAKRKLTDAQKQAMERVTAQAKQDVDAAVRNRAEERIRFQQQAGSEAGVQGTVPPDQALPENVSNEEKEGNPLAPGNGNGIMGEGTKGENAGGAGNEGKADEQKAGTGSFEYYIGLAKKVDVSTGVNQAVFYSGKGNRELAVAFALSNGKMTLEMTPGGKYFDDLKLFDRSSPLTDAQALEVWKILSKRYAEAASGNVYGLVKGSNPGSIFNSVEYLTLLHNPKVINILTEFFK